MASNDLSTLIDALIFALLVAVACAIAWGVFRVTSRRYGVRRAASAVSTAAIVTVALGALAVWPAAPSAIDVVTGDVVPDGSAPEPQRTAEPDAAAPQPPLPTPTQDVDGTSTRQGDETSPESSPTDEPANDQQGGGNGPGPSQPGPDPNPDPEPPQSPSPDPVPTSSPVPTASPSPSPGNDDDDDDDDDRPVGLNLVLDLLSLLP